jgi:hypothetical protein
MGLWLYLEEPLQRTFYASQAVAVAADSSTHPAVALADYFITHQHP